MSGRHPIAEVADLYVTLRGRADQFVKSMGEAQGASLKADSGMSKVLATSKLLAVGLAAGAVAVGAASVMMASKFDATMEKVHTQAGATQAEVESMKSKVLSLAGQTAQAPEDLAEALYHVESVGYRGATAISVLDNAAKLASISGANLDDVTYGLTSVLQTYGATASQAAQYAAMFNATVGAGDMQMQDFSKAVGTGFYATAQSFGVSMQSASAGLAFMTDRGQGAQQAATHLRMTMSLLAAPTQRAAALLGDLGMQGPAIQASTSAMTAALTKAGLSTVTMSEDLKKPDGLFVALSDLKTHLEQSGLSASAASALIANAFGGGKTDATILSMLNDLDNLQQKYEAVGHGVSSYGESWAATQQQFSFRVRQLKDTGEAWAISLGEKLIPILTKVLGVVQQAIGWFQKHQAVTHALAQVIGVVLVGALTLAAYFLGVMAVEMVAAAAGPLLLMAAIGAVVVGLVKLYQHSAGFRAFVDGLASSIKSIALVALHWLEDAWHKVAAVVGQVVGALVGWYHSHETQVRETFTKVKAALSSVGAAIKGAFDVIATVIGTVVHVIENLWTRFGSHLLEHLETAFNAIVQIVKGVFDVIRGIFDIFVGIFTGKWSRVWKGIKEVFSGVWSVLSGIVKFAINLISTIIGTAVSVISAIWGYLWRGIVGIAEWAWKYIVKGVEGFWNVITSSFSKAWSWVTSITSTAWHAVAGFFSNLFDDVVGAVGGFFSNLPGYIADGLSAIGSFFSGLGSDILNAIESLAEWAWKGLEWLAMLPVKIYDYVVSQGGLLGIGKKIGAKLLDALKSIGSGLAGLASSLWHGFVGALERGATAVWDFFKSLPVRIKGLVITAGLWIAKTGHDLITGFLNGIVSTAENVWGWLKALPGKILTFVADIALWLYYKGKDLITGAYNGIVNEAESVWAWLKALPGRILTFVTDIGLWLYYKGRDLLTGAYNGIVNAATTVWTWFKGLPGVIGGFFSDAATWLYNAGMNIVTGIWNGISGAAGWLWGKIKDFTGGIVKHALSFLGIKSPSTVMRDQVGKWIPPGIAAGIDAAAPTAHAAVSRLADGMVTAASAGAARLAKVGSFGAGPMSIAAGIQAQVDPATQAMQRLVDGVVKVAATMSRSISQALGGDVALTRIALTTAAAAIDGGGMTGTTATGGAGAIQVAPAAATGGGGDLHVHLNFRGATVIGGDLKKLAEELAPAIEQAMLRRGMRRGKTWKEYAR